MINYLYQEQNWKTQLSDLITDPKELLQQLQLSTDQLLSGAILASEQFKLRVPRAFVAKMNVGDALDPLLLQVLPHHLELEDHPEFVTDPLGEKEANQLPGVLHKYQSRFLLTLTGACAVHCRYCFRRHFPYQENLPKNNDWDNIRSYIQQNPQINEIILSGGDPLTLTNAKLELWVKRLESLPQVKILRIHTRVPIVIPSRIDDELVALLKKSTLRIVMVVHSNHPAELDAYTIERLQYLAMHQITVLNQAVLLKGVNDCAEILSQLSYRLFEAKVMPYYLHVLDKVKGAQHFDLESQKINQIYTALLATLPGYLVPKLVREIAGENNKTPLYGEQTF
ncbi:EF-P beta-lysylation protein EpmB [Acinetobacter sp. MD2]|uniref:EF-P beta-lysylation protein EpmB n=1 Tax=Acinetobacter sp. MD2 TaxID=2600066 RepID=UPI002D1E6AB8|nr:EF-P beta-lysylation protein EpmB [Acinetobacter sp. MD2]MEB3767807.1 EF-P beta-lysylation protein EpmB [Acinetobacter sp. MD2]